jgi:hypothetical protein
MAIDINGCRVLQRLLERFQPGEIAWIYDEIFGNLKLLRTDKYGNYVVSHILEFGPTS